MIFTIGGRRVVVLGTRKRLDLFNAERVEYHHAGIVDNAKTHQQADGSGSPSILVFGFFRELGFREEGQKC